MHKTSDSLLSDPTCRKNGSSEAVGDNLARGSFHGTSALHRVLSTLAQGSMFGKLEYAQALGAYQGSWDWRSRSARGVELNWQARRTRT